MKKEVLKVKKASKTVDVTCNTDGRDIKFKVINYIPVVAQFLLVRIYLDAYFNSAIEDIEDIFISKWDYVGAENALMLAIIDDFTDIPVVDNDGKSLIDIDNIVHVGVWDSIKLSIKNYKEFRKALYIMIEDAKREILSKKSVGHVIDGIANKAILFLNGLGELDLSEDGVSKLMDSIGDLSKQLEDSPIGSLLDESKK